ncbi:glycosyltransferase family 1 protein [Alteromonas aestuariivivens]|uniref:Glycosyltransferase family 1 protein n=1 Tax=Alteromonas aestuariivivens TaxID=1938339 RepID=A0A3D8MEA2_9ALTE|nr:glycosyltransferase [Alteromonas aestuariivivens]RDV28930.1 glycosyltransferase family 1 protein [Alteromonas aestuariivivens]
MRHTDGGYLCIYLPSVTGHHLTYLDKVIRALEPTESLLVLTPAVNEEFNRITACVGKVIQYERKFSANSFIQSFHECRVLLKCTQGYAIKKVIAPTGCSAAFLWPLFNVKARFDYHFLMLSPALINNKSVLENLVKAGLLCMHRKGKLSTIDNASYNSNGLFGRFIRNKFSLIPDPIDTNTPAEKADALKHFGLEKGDFNVLMCGALNSHPRKNTLTLIKSVIQIPPGEKIRLVLAGRISPDILDYIATLPAEQSRKLLVINRFLSDQELMDITHCCNLVCTPYTHHYSPSGIVLRAIKTRTPVLVPNYHWFRYMKDNYGIGYSVETLSEDNIAQAIVDIKNRKKPEPLFGHQQELIDYFSAENFQQHWKAIVYSRSQLMGYADIRLP